MISGGNVLAVTFLALSGLARSNGILNAGYFCYQTMHRAYDAVFQKRQASVSSSIIPVPPLVFIFYYFLQYE